MLTTEQALEAELAVARNRAEVDRLTGCGTLYALDSVLGECFREGIAFELVLFDVAKLKSANEVEGYAWANKLLARVGHVLRKHRGDGYAIRQGGDEFMIVLPGATREAAELVRERVENAVGVDVIADGTAVYLAGGVASWAQGDGPFAEVLDTAQEEMKNRKAALVF